MRCWYRFFRPGGWSWCISSSNLAWTRGSWFSPMRSRPARVGRDLIGENQLPLVHAKFELEIHQDHPPGLKKRYQQRIDPRAPLLDAPQHVRIETLHEHNISRRAQ